MKYLIAGLGNPGLEYANTRHNIGYIVADALASEAKANFSAQRHAEQCKVRFKGRTLVCIKPTTFMNLSGKAIRYWLEKEKIPLDHLLVIVDDIALPLGTLRLKASGSDGGHNGLEDIIRILGSTAFPRLRIGIGNDFAKGHQVDYVLGKWTREEEMLMTEKVEKAVLMIKSFVSVGIVETMNTYNNK